MISEIFPKLPGTRSSSFRDRYFTEEKSSRAGEGGTRTDTRGRMRARTGAHRPNMQQRARTSTQAARRRTKHAAPALTEKRRPTVHPAETQQSNARSARDRASAGGDSPKGNAKRSRLSHARSGELRDRGAAHAQTPPEPQAHGRPDAPRAGGPGRHSWACRRTPQTGDAEVGSCARSGDAP